MSFTAPVPKIQQRKLAQLHPGTCDRSRDQVAAINLELISGHGARLSHGNLVCKMPTVPGNCVPEFPIQKTSCMTPAIFRGRASLYLPVSVCPSVPDFLVSDFFTRGRCQTASFLNLLGRVKGEGKILIHRGRGGSDKVVNTII